MDSIISFFDQKEAGEALIQLAPLFTSASDESVDTDPASQHNAALESEMRGWALHACRLLTKLADVLEQSDKPPEGRSKQFWTLLGVNFIEPVISKFKS